MPRSLRVLLDRVLALAGKCVEGVRVYVMLLSLQLARAVVLHERLHPTATPVKIPRPKWNDGEGEQGRTPTQLSWHVFGNDTDLELARMPWRSKQALDQQGNSAETVRAAAGELTRQEPCNACSAWLL